MKRKFLSLILVFAMTVSLLTVGTGAVEPTYGDTAGHWAESSIERWSAYGIIQGSNGEFDPNGQLTCAQLATILAKLLKLPAAPSAGFSDVAADAWYADAINRCVAAGILNGNGDGTVSPTAPITRERAMVMLGRALGIKPIENPDLTKYGDAAKVSAYAQGYVAAMIETGIVTGVGSNQIAPQDDINRASTVTILDRAIAIYADKDGATIDAKDGGLILIVAKNVKVVNAPEGTTIVVADGATGLNVNDKAVTDDQTYVVPKAEPAKPSSGSSSGGSSGGHSHSILEAWTSDDTYHWHEASCGRENHRSDKAEHTWNVVTTAATCTEDGSKTYTCTVCGKTKTETIAATGHTPVPDAAIAPTCTEDGKGEGSHCLTCNAIIDAQETIPATGHNYAYVTTWDTLVSTKTCTKGDFHESIENIYYINNDTNLEAFRGLVNAGNTFEGKTIELMVDIDLNNTEWTPIGNESGKAFAGTFDGNNKTINNLKITSGGYIGLFGYVGGGATIKNVNLVGANVSGTERVGGLIGKITGNTTVSNCSIDETSNISGTGSNTGGFIGEAVNGTAIALSGLTNKATVTNTASSNARAGGIVGQITTNANVTITNCRNEGAITAKNGYAGGIVSAYQHGTLTIDECANSGALTGTNKGDLVAWITSVRSLSISEYDGVVADMIGLLDANYKRNITVNDTAYFLNAKNVAFKFASALDGEQELDTTRVDNIIDFIKYGKLHNHNFVADNYPETRWGVFDTYGGFGGNGWQQLLDQYNSEKNKTLTADNLAINWNTSTMYYFSAQD